MRRRNAKFRLNIFIRIYMYKYYIYWKELESIRMVWYTLKIPEIEISIKLWGRNAFLPPILAGSAEIRNSYIFALVFVRCIYFINVNAKEAVFDWLVFYCLRTRSGPSSAMCAMCAICVLCVYVWRKPTNVLRWLVLRRKAVNSKVFYWGRLDGDGDGDRRWEAPEE